MADGIHGAFAARALQGAGQVLPTSKTHLIRARLTGLMRREGFGSLEDLHACLETRKTNEALNNDVISRLVPRASAFFRDADRLRLIVDDVLPRRLEEGQERLRIWCAGAAAGQEAYSLAILLSENEALREVKIDLLATDLSEDAVARIRSGTYTQFEIQKGLSVGRMLTHFHRTSDGDWQAKRDLRDRIAVRVHNLLHPMDGFGDFDVILCRNVLSTMARTFQEDILARLSARLKAGGLVLFGAEERINALADHFEPARNVRGFHLTVADAEASAAA